jgi:TonB dependent receptor
LNYAYSSYKGHEAFLPVTILDASGAPIEPISFTVPGEFSTDQNETSWFAGDQWTTWQRLTLSLGVRFDGDTVTGSTHVVPRTGIVLALTRDGRTLLKGGAGLFYDRVPLTIPTFDRLPDRTVSILDSGGNQPSATTYLNQLTGSLRNPRSTSWSVALERQVLESFALHMGFEQRNTSRVFVVSPISYGKSGIVSVSNPGRDLYREFQVSGRYKLPRLTVNGSYVHSRAYGNLNDPSLFFGNYSQAVIQPDARARLSIDAPNRYLLWGDLEVPWKLTLLPVYDLHTGFPYSVENEFREYISPRQSRRFPRFSSLDLQLSRPVLLHMGERKLHMRAGFGITVFARSIVRKLLGRIDQFIYAGRSHEFFNAALQELVDQGAHVGFSSTSGLPWAEIDDATDLQFARKFVFPHLTPAPA